MHEHLFEIQILFNFIHCKWNFIQNCNCLPNMFLKMSRISILNEDCNFFFSSIGLISRPVHDWVGIDSWSLKGKRRAIITTPFDWSFWRQVPVFMFSILQILKVWGKAACPVWYRHYHLNALYYSLRDVLLPSLSIHRNTSSIGTISSKTNR